MNERQNLELDMINYQLLLELIESKYGGQIDTHHCLSIVTEIKELIEHQDAQKLTYDHILMILCDLNLDYYLVPKSWVYENM